MLSRACTLLPYRASLVCFCALQFPDQVTILTTLCMQVRHYSSFIFQFEHSSTVSLLSVKLNITNRTKLVLKCRWI